MGLRKRGNSYQIDYFDPDGKRIRVNFKKRKIAEQELAKRITLIAENRYFLDIHKESEATIKELFDKYTEMYKHQASYKTGKKYCLINFREYFKENTRLVDIKYYDLEVYRNHLRQKLTKHKTKRKDATINREMVYLQHAFNKAVEWDMLKESQNPFKKGKRLQVKENNKRLRFLSVEEIDQLLTACPEPARAITTMKDIRIVKTLEASYLKDFIIIALNTGMRKGEILSLRWKQIWGDFIYLTKTKSNEARQIPLTDDLRERLDNIKMRPSPKKDYIFPNKKEDHKKGEKEGHIQDIKKSFKSALKRAGISDFRPHDLRHTFASHYIMRGGSLKALKEILGHSDIKMTMRYAHLSKEFAKEEIQLINGLTSVKKSGNKKNKTNTVTEVSQT